MRQRTTTIVLLTISAVISVTIWTLFVSDYVNEDSDIRFAFDCTEGTCTVSGEPTVSFVNGACIWTCELTDISVCVWSCESTGAVHERTEVTVCFLNDNKTACLAVSARGSTDRVFHQLAKEFPVGSEHSCCIRDEEARIEVPSTIGVYVHVALDFMIVLGLEYTVLRILRKKIEICCPIMAGIEPKSSYASVQLVDRSLLVLAGGYEACTPPVSSLRSTPPVSSLRSTLNTVSPEEHAAPCVVLVGE